MQHKCTRTKRRGTTATERKLSAIRNEIGREAASVKRAMKREASLLAALLGWSLEPLATKRDIERVREEIRELRRPR